MFPTMKCLFTLGCNLLDSFLCRFDEILARICQRAAASTPHRVTSLKESKVALTSGHHRHRRLLLTVQYKHRRVNPNTGTHKN